MLRPDPFVLQEVIKVRDFNRYKIGLFLAIFSVIVLTVTGFFSLKAYNSSKKTERQITDSVQGLKDNVIRLETRIEAFEKLMKERQTLSPTSNVKGGSGASSDEISKSQKGKSGTPSDKSKMVKVDQKTARQSQLELMGNMDPNVIQDLYDERVKKMEIESELSFLREMAGEQRQTDKNQYDEAANDLYRQTLPRGLGNNQSEEERENALNELLEKYPDSYAAAKAVSVKAIESVIRGNIDAAESYYNMLIEVQGQKTDRVVFDDGFEAVPTVEHTLAWAYYRSGRTEDVKTMVKSLEENYSDSVYRVRSRGGPTIITGQEAIERIRRITGIGEETEGNP